MKVLLVEDDDDTARYVARGLRAQGFGVERAQNAEDGQALASGAAFDVIVIDRMLPGADGLSLTRRLRDQHCETPILFLTTMSGINDRVEGLEAGGDDYLVKPFALAELIARVNSLTRRTKRSGAGVQARLVCGDLEMDLVERTVTRSGKRIELQPQEFRLLEYLMRHAGRVVTRTMLLENVWELYFDPRTNIVESHMSRLRAKIDKEFAVPVIQTLRGKGYMLRGE